MYKKLNFSLHIAVMILFQICSLFVITAGAGGHEAAWHPSNTRVFIVGALEWKKSETFSSYPQKNRRDEKLVNFFKKAGVPDEKIVYLKDTAATADSVRETLSSHLAKSKSDETLFLYYCGHGYRTSDAKETFFASYDAGVSGVKEWSLSSIFSDIESKFKGKRVMLAADCCHSGTLCDIASERSGGFSYACFASATATNSSTGNWTFTERLLLGFSGAACSDINRDGVITLGELSEDITADMAFAEGQMASSKFTGDFKPDMAVAHVEKKRDENIGRRIEARSSGDWYKALVLDTKKNKSFVHYYGWDEEYDEWLSPENIREAAKNKTYQKGEAVEVEWNKKWYPATIIKSERGLYFVHYKDYDASWNEWAGPLRIRKN